MESPFYTTFWRPARPGAAAATAKPPRPAKVVSVPVHFVGSGQEDHRQHVAGGGPTASSTRSAAALRIQRAFRGFLVRKNLGSVRSLEAEMDGIEREMKENEERLRLDGRERVRVSEALMSVLLRLDSVRGVRECRRRAIRRAIALQEAADAMASGKEAQASMEIQQAAETPLETPGDGDRASSARSDVNGEGRFEEKDSDGDIMAEEVKQEDKSNAADAVEETLEALNANRLSEEDSKKDGTIHIESGAKEATGEGPEDLHRDRPAADDVMQASMIEDEGSADVKTVESCVTGEMLPDPTPSIPSMNMAVAEGGHGCGENTRQAMERMVGESRGLKGLVAELCERNELQCRLMSGLLQRVEHLEKVVERMGRKKRRQAADARKARARKCGRKF